MPIGVNRGEFNGRSRLSLTQESHDQFSQRLLFLISQNRKQILQTLFPVGKKLLPREEITTRLTAT